MKAQEIQNRMTQVKELFEAGVLSTEHFAKYELKLKQQLAELEKPVVVEKPVVIEKPVVLDRDRSIPRVGDILCCSWGYNMILVDFYKVVKITPSGKSISVVGMGSECVEGEAGYSGFVMPSQYEDTTVIKNKRITKYDNSYGIKISSCQHAYTWNGEKQYFDKMD